MARDGPDELVPGAYAARRVNTGGAFLPQQRLYFWPDLQGQGALRGIKAGFDCDGAGSDWVCFAELSGVVSAACFVGLTPAAKVA